MTLCGDVQCDDNFPLVVESRLVYPRLGVLGNAKQNMKLNMVAGVLYFAPLKKLHA